MMDGIASGQTGGGRHSGARVSAGAARAAWRALKVTPSNKRMHATADTRDVIFGQLVGRRVMRGVRHLREGEK
jgi:hypothetical protein